MNKEEKQILISEKKRNGKSEIESIAEVLAEELTLQGYKKLKKKLKDAEKEILRLNNKIDNLNKRLKKPVNKIFKESFKQIKNAVGITMESKGKANTDILKRVIHAIKLKGRIYMKSEIKELSNECCISRSQAEDSLFFITKYCNIT